MWKKIGILCSFFSVAFSTVSCGEKQWDEKIMFIDSVHDGDTFNSGDLRIRLFGVDTPEVGKFINKSKDYEETKGIEKIYGDKATTFAKKLIEHKRVLVKRVTTGVYGRTVAKVVVNYKDLGEELIKNGWARVAYMDMNPKSPFYTSDFSYYQNLLELQYQAYKNEKGIWSDKDNFKLIFPKA